MNSQPPSAVSVAGRGLLFIVSAPSGAGKTTLVERLAEQTPHLKMSRSYTSRPAREGESDGVDYNFVSRVRFEGMIAAGDFWSGRKSSGTSTGRARPIPNGCSPRDGTWSS